ncbi:MAG: putative rane protein [Cyanobacteria bacterium RYN_339]|nr:putative rane protein [Cyanobacteria bacterium RYN_339]
MMGPPMHRTWPPTCLLLLLALAFGPTVATGGLLAFGDGLGYYMPARAIAAASVLHGEWPFWNPFNFAGTPLLAAFQGGVFFPSNWGFLVLPPGAAMNLAVLLGYGVAGLATYAYGRAIALPRVAAFLAGASFMGGGYMVAHLEHLTMLHGAGMLPAMLWAVERHAATDRPRYALALAAALAGQVFAGYPQTVLVSLPLVAAYAVWRLGFKRALVPVAAALGLGLGLAAVQLLPASTMIAASERGHLDYAALTESSLPPKQLASFLFPFLFGAVPSGLFPTPYWGGGQWPNEITGYLGLVPLMLAIAAQGARRTLPAVRFWTVTGVLTLLLALGGATPLYRLWAVLPVLQAVRIPGRHLLEVDLALALLAGCGLAFLLEGGAAARRWALVGGGIVAGGVLAGIAAIAIAGAGVAGRLQPLMPAGVDLAATLRPGYSGVWLPAVLAALGFAAIMLTARGRGAGALVVTATLLDLGLFGQCLGWRQLAPHPAEAPPSPLPPLARGRTLAVSAHGYPFNDYALMRRLGYPQLGALWGVEAIGGYEPIQPARYHRLVGGISPSGVLPDESVFASSFHALDVLGCREVRFEAAGQLAPPRWQPTGAGFVNASALPPAWRPTHVEVGEVDARMTGQRPFDPASTALFDDGPAPAGLAPGPATLSWQGFDHLRVETDGPGPGLVVVAAAFDPGWTARGADGADLPVRRVDGLVLGVEVPAGRQAITFAYEPPRWRAGLAASFMSLLAGLWWAWRGRRRPA